MRILVCNDDGIGAPGLHLVGAAARALSPDVWLVGPERKWTAASHHVSFDRELSLTRVAPREYACSGTPVDCVIAALSLLFSGEPKPDLVIAGLNDKINVAEDIAYSGTMGIAREAVFWGIPAIALSRDHAGAEPLPDPAAITALVRVLWDARTYWSGPGQWLSLNLPARLPAPLVPAHVGRDKIAGACETLSSSPDRTTFRLVRGRPGTSQAGDERAVLSTGAIAVLRHRWFTAEALDDDTVEQWNRALG